MGPHSPTEVNSQLSLAQPQPAVCSLLTLAGCCQVSVLAIDAGLDKTTKANDLSDNFLNRRKLFTSGKSRLQIRQNENILITVS